ncbi:MAG: Fic family protein [Anaerolineae bacterium]|nr:Fic family protein [Anaerolineae bacterium]
MALRSGQFDEAGLLAIHAGVMDGLLPGYQIGRYRREPVVIRDPRTRDLIFLPPDWQDVPALMAQLVAFVQEQRGILDPLLLAGLFHKQFVIIHPFMDGNGRTARLATKQLLAALGLNLFPLLSFENGYNRNVTRYFQQVGLRGNYYDVATTADFTDWLEYFADGILDELLRLQETVSARSRTPDTRLQPHHEALLAFIDTHGFITDRDYAQLTDRAKATRTLDFRKLIDLGLIERRGRGPQYALRPWYIETEFFGKTRFLVTYGCRAARSSSKRAKSASTVRGQLARSSRKNDWHSASVKPRDSRSRATAILLSNVG